jgi:hypothetical protein
MNRFILTIASISMPIVMLGLTQPGFAQDNGPKTRERIGVYDSRSIAVAFARSPAHEKELQHLMTEHRKAKEAGNLDKVAQLEAEGRARQEKAHKQAFSTEPVDDLLLNITNALPEIHKAAGVTIFISKWDEAGQRKYAGAEKVDVTLRLVDAFQPTERQRKRAIEIQTRKPIAPDKIKD